MSNSTDNEAVAVDEVAKGFQLLFLTSAFATAFVLNAVVAYSLRDKRHLAVAGNIFVANLISSNLVDSFLSIPIVIIGGVGDRWALGSFACAISAVTHSVLLFNGNLTLALIAVDRYYAIVKPMKYRKEITTRRAVYALITTWILSVAFTSIPVSGWSTYVYHSYTFACSVSMRQHPAYSLCIYVGFVLAPFLAMSVCYGYVYAASSLQKRSVDSLSGEPSSGFGKNEKLRNKLPWIVVTYNEPAKVRRYVSFILFSYVLCWTVILPSIISDFKISYMDPRLYFFLYFIHRLLAVFNPLIYGFMNASIKCRIARDLCKSRTKVVQTPPPVIVITDINDNDKAASESNDDADTAIKPLSDEDESPTGFFDFVPDTSTIFRYGVDSSDILKKIDPIEYYYNTNKPSQTVNAPFRMFGVRSKKKTRKRKDDLLDAPESSNDGGSDDSDRSPVEYRYESSLDDGNDPKQYRKRIYSINGNELDLVMEVEDCSDFGIVINPEPCQLTN